MDLLSWRLITDAYGASVPMTTRVVLMSLTDKASKEFASLSSRRDEIVDLCFPA